jgi:hypothetical protein
MGVSRRWPPGAPLVRPLAVLAAAVLLWSGGCAAPEAAVDAPTVETAGGSLPDDVDAGEVYQRLRTLLVTNVSAPSSVTVLNDSTVATGGGPSVPTPAPFRAFGVDPAPDERGETAYRYAGATSMTGQVRLYPGEKPTGLVRTILVHEYVHYVQLRRGDDRRLREALGRTTDARFVRRSVIEGVAVDVTDAYLDRHLPDTESNAALYERLDEVYPRGTPSWYGNAMYRFGTRYVDGQVEDAATALAVAERPPRTSEQVIHGYAPGAEPPRNLSVAVAAAESPWRSVGTDRMGEAFLLAALGSVSRERARTAAEGWGADRLQILRRSGVANASYALVTRWDDAENATEFETAYADALTARGERTADDWRVDGRAATIERAGPETVVVLVGSAAFVDGTTVDGDGETVTVEPPGE